jgi:uncharacterized protein (TIGR00730 family)
MTRMPRLCVFCGSATGSDPAFARAARELAAAMCERGIGLVYGGSHVGLMGVLADEVLARRGDAIGVIPKFLVDREIAHRGLSQLIVVDSMHERKACMVKHADAFLALPGGFGTLDELMEAQTWRQLGLHDKPIGLLDTAGFYQQLGAFIAHVVASGFVSAEHARAIRIERDVPALLESLFPTAR